MIIMNKNKTKLFKIFNKEKNIYKILSKKNKL